MQLSEISLSVDEVAHYLASLDTSKACGPDGIPSRILKECSQQIAPSLCEIFNHSLQFGRIPSQWKTADVTPIHKKDLKEPAENYRPISLLPILSKVLERCVYNRLYDHIIHLITGLQHGFLRNRSCVTQLLSVLHNIGQNLDKNIQTDVLYLDFAKAFDSVDHLILLQKLKSYGVTGPILDWFTDYLTGRLQRVVVDSVASQWAPVTSGVPQGSILGPLLFVIFINDLPEVIPDGTSTALYADDSKLYRSVTSETDCKTLQQALTNLNAWSIKNNMRFNTSKCKVLSVTRKKSPLSFDYYLGKEKLESVQEEKDLGVIMSTKLSWESHINNIVAKANKLLGLLKRTCPLLTDTRVRRTLYLSLIKSQLCYASEIWSPVHSTVRQRIEKVQRRATRWILRTKPGEIPYKQRLLILDLLPLSYDREIKDLVFFYKALNGYINLNINNYVSFVNHSRTRLSQTSSFILQISLCKTSTFQATFFNRIVKIWNTVCKKVPINHFSSPCSFKLYLRRIYSSLVSSVFDTERTCTWSLSRDCPCHRT